MHVASTFYCCCHFSFNPVAKTMLSRALNRMVSLVAKTVGNVCEHYFFIIKTSRKFLVDGHSIHHYERYLQRDGQYEAPSSEAVESLVTSSCGDIRAAVNALQFACTKGML